MKLFFLLRSVQLALVVYAAAVVPSAQAGSATWNLDPATSDWTFSGNWTPETVPSQPADTATFEASNQTSVSIFVPINATFNIGAIQFNSGASTFTITLAESDTIVQISGAGIVNNSGLMQNFTGERCSYLEFRQSATIGDLVTITNPQNEGCGASVVYFFDSASAGGSTIINEGAAAMGNYPAITDFFDSSTAGNANISNQGANSGGISPGLTGFYQTSSAGNATITNTAAAGFPVGLPGETAFEEQSTADHATVISSAAFVLFEGESRAADATLIAHGGTISFAGDSRGERARIELSGDGQLNVSLHALPGLSVGSIEGGGTVVLGANQFGVGGNNLNTTYHGEISGTGSLIKVGRGELILANANTYSGGTTVEHGRLTVENMNGSGTGTGPVQTVGGTLAGTGTLAGAVTVGIGTGRGALLLPAGGRVGSLTFQSTLTLGSDATYKCTLNSDQISADKLIANGVTIGSALISFVDIGSSVLPIGSILMIIDNTAAIPIAGTFSNLADGGIITIGVNNFQANYEGGDGNDLTLTVVP